MLLPYHLYFVVTQVPSTSLALKSGIALVLIALVAMTSAVAIVLRAKVKRARKW
jgi:ABC-type phosphate transport system permease subunit